eukprot:1148849-Pelagomonas_calceolata.AAC.3
MPCLLIGMYARSTTRHSTRHYKQGILRQHALLGECMQREQERLQREAERMRQEAERLRMP